MRKILSIILLLSAAPVSAREAGEFGLGVVAGNPTAATGKYWINRIRAIDFGVGASGDATVYVDHLWHGWKAFPQPKEGRLAAHLGLGARWEEEDRREDELYLRAVTGVSYWLKSDLVELFAELVPTLRISPNSDGGLDGGVGIRYYFKGFN